MVNATGKFTVRQYRLNFLQEAERGLMDAVPHDIPLAQRIWKDDACRVRNTSFRYSQVEKCIVCGTCRPKPDYHHIFNQRNAIRIGIQKNNQFVVRVCPNCHRLVHECGTSKREIRSDDGAWKNSSAFADYNKLVEGMAGADTKKWSEMSDAITIAAENVVKEIDKSSRCTTVSRSRSQ